MNDNNKFWDKEYLKKGIPSSFRDEPSGVLLWCLQNLKILEMGEKHPKVLDVGCGKGRNSVFLAQNGFNVTALDSSKVAIRMANKLALSLNKELRPKFLHQKIQDGLPGNKNQFDLITDIFVYKHQINLDDRKRYRKDIKKVLKKTGILLISLADKEDGYYSQCPEVPNNNLGLKTIMDEAVNIQSVLFNLTELSHEMADCFKLEMVWFKVKDGLMHGKHYQRRTFATIWRPK
jgi:2-polyprenyl-3-methyl-5-hydroxy-6-metoxy-1,4-benzoquinol methylase